MTFQNYQRQTDRAIPDHDNKKDAVLHWCIGLSEEVGEVMSVIKHHFYGGEPLDRKAELEEKFANTDTYKELMEKALGGDT